MTDILQEIIAHKAKELIELKKNKPISELQRLSANSPLAKRGFVQALATKAKLKKPAVIAEVKKASPSKGVIRENFDPIAIAKCYESAGATCLSVLTDEKYFQGSADYLMNIRKISSLPMLRKDFIIDPYQIYESNAMGADCILLIVAALDDQQLQDFSSLAAELNLDVLVEVHNEAELQRALALNTTLIGINNRNLKTFVTTLDNTLNLLALIPKDKIVITESGIHTQQDVNTMLNHHVYGFLVGESLMRADDPKAMFQTLFHGADC